MPAVLVGEVGLYHLIEKKQYLTWLAYLLLDLAHTRGQYEHPSKLHFENSIHLMPALSARELYLHSRAATPTRIPTTSTKKRKK